MSEQASTALVRRENRTPGIAIRTYDELRQFSVAAAASGFVAKGESRESAIAKAMMIVQYGAELGIGPMGALQGINIIEGRPAMNAGLMSARIKQSGRYDYDIIELTPDRCVIRFFALDGGRRRQLTPDSVFTIEDAKRAGVVFTSRSGNPTNWTRYPRNMLFARALSNGARWHCPDIFGGPVYTPEEIASGDVIDAHVVESVSDDAGQPEAVQAQVVEDCDGALLEALRGVAYTEDRRAYYASWRDGGRLDKRGLAILGALLRSEANTESGRQPEHGMGDDERAALAEALALLDAEEPAPPVKADDDVDPLVAALLEVDGAKGHDARMATYAKVRDAQTLSAEKLEIVRDYISGLANLDNGDPPEKGMSPEQVVNFDRAVSLVDEARK